RNDHGRFAKYARGPVGFGMQVERMENSEWRVARFSQFAIRYSLFAVILAACATHSAIAQDRPSAFVDAAAVVPGLIVEMRYAGAHNFVGRPIDGYEAPRCLLTKPAATALAGVAKDV